MRNPSSKSSGFPVIDLSGNLLEESFAAQLWILSHAMFVWIGPGNAPPQLGSLSTAMMTRYEPMPLITSLVGSPDFEEQQIAQRLARRTGKPCFVSCRLPDHVPELFAFVEKKIVERLVQEKLIVTK
ncbi:TPA: hypothetical protein N0F65_008390 [Lagenidium giganteum]|uniref:Proteasome assembly chaperone 4 n=1 Tax=Lagenidium giganteum TaxID=4803 RepID=A0AAV2YYF9_9STRA|nr:TPA: hypothetical protein N0F65_008390 [Lagenidium giganteum]